MRSTRLFLLNSTPLLEEKWNLGSQALIPNIRGTWNEGLDDQRVFYRSWIGPELSESAIGFRCAKDVTP